MTQEWISVTPEQKAKELYDKFYDLGHLIETTYAKEHCKKCVIVCVDEILSTDEIFENIPAKYYWDAVKEEIEKL